MRAWLRFAAVLGIGLAAAPVAPAAQSEPNQDGTATEIQQFEDWTLRCRSATETNPRICRLHQRLVAKEDDNLVVRIVVGRFGPENVLGAVIFVPVGVRLPPGLGIKVDELPLRVFPFEICTPESCQTRAVLEGALLKDFRAGLTGYVKFQDSNGQVLGVPISLKGFSAALRALP